MSGEAPASLINQSHKDPGRPPTKWESLKSRVFFTKAQQAKKGEERKRQISRDWLEALLGGDETYPYHKTLHLLFLYHDKYDFDPADVDKEGSVAYEHAGYSGVSGPEFGPAPNPELVRKIKEKWEKQWPELEPGSTKRHCENFQEAIRWTR
ncbi:hypothetical protein B0T17DRAFT_504461 [Bombardia bombarda]|uniref:Uncharacterized protein n=1 Tax=Bombardia bombarda TaxID=252184 RepID=A0AA39XN38_9PEZI|nr:hypothetical protein B0T17DRAFT_504461 [Bombardia bombarda]